MPYLRKLDCNYYSLSSRTYSILALKLYRLFVGSAVLQLLSRSATCLMVASAVGFSPAKLPSLSSDRQFSGTLTTAQLTTRVVQPQPNKYLRVILIRLKQTTKSKS